MRQRRCSVELGLIESLTIWAIDLSSLILTDLAGSKPTEKIAESRMGSVARHFRPELDGRKVSHAGDPTWAGVRGARVRTDRRHHCRPARTVGANHRRGHRCLWGGERCLSPIAASRPVEPGCHHPASEPTSEHVSRLFDSTSGRDWSRLTTSPETSSITPSTPKGSIWRSLTRSGTVSVPRRCPVGPLGPIACPPPSGRTPR